MLRTPSRRPVFVALCGFLLTGAVVAGPALAASGTSAQSDVATSSASTASQNVAQMIPGAPQPPILPDVVSYVVMDARTGAVMAEKAPTLLRAPASLTKMMTAYLTYQALEQGTLKLDQKVPVSVAAWKAGGSRMFLSPDMKVTVDQLLHGLIIQSGNDAATALAEAIGGTQEAFVQRMNDAAEKLGLTDTHYTNVSGLPGPDLHTTALDVAKLSRAIILQYPQFLQISAEKEYTFNKITQRSWNPVLFADKTVDGLKTGLTDAAGHCIAATALRGDRRVIAVELGSPDWDSATFASEALLNYGYGAFVNATVVTAGQPVGEMTDPQVDPETVAVGPARDLVLTVPRDIQNDIRPTLHLATTLPETLPKGTQVGTISYMADGNLFATVPAVTLTDTKPAGFFTRMMRRVQAAL